MTWGRPVNKESTRRVWRSTVSGGRGNQSTHLIPEVCREFVLRAVADYTTGIETNRYSFFLVRPPIRLPGQESTHRRRESVPPGPVPPGP